MTEPEGGDPACWLDRVCEDCGAVLDDRPHDCPRRPEPEVGQGA